jgi:hypothetical protein
MEFKLETVTIPDFEYVILYWISNLTHIPHEFINTLWDSKMVTSLRRKTGYCELYENPHLRIKQTYLSRDQDTENETQILIH